MFDLRYHVASLAAVFLALIIGILVGAGMSGRGLLDQAERTNLNRQIADLKAELESEQRRSEAHLAAQQFAERAAPAVLADRLAGKGIALVFVGPVDAGVRSAVEGAVQTAGGRVVRLRALAAPMRPDAILAAAAGGSSADEYAGEEGLAALGRDLGREFVAGEETPLWDALMTTLVEERGPDGRQPADGLVVARTAPPQYGDAADFLRGFYRGLNGPVPSVGVESSTAVPSAVSIFRRHGLSSVDSIDLPAGRVALVLVLAGGRPGHYGVKDSAEEALPPIEPLVAPAG
jgi:hypothetical protein